MNRLRLILLLSFAPAFGQTLPHVKPEQVGMSKERLNRIRPVMEKHIAENHISGAIGLIARRGKIAYLETYGQMDKAAGKPMREDTIFRIFSMTKAVTGVAAMMLYEEGKFFLSDPLSKYIPEFGEMKVATEKGVVPAEHQITIRDLMRHTSGLNYIGPRDEKGNFVYRELKAMGGEVPLAEAVSRLSKAPLVHEPGTIFDYGYSIDVLGRVVEVVSGKTLDQFFQDRIFKPLHMGDTGFYVPKEKWDRLVALDTPNADQTVRRATGPLQDACKTKPVAFLGGQGLVSTVNDYARFCQMLLNGGELDHVRLLSPKSVELMSADHLGDLPKVGALLPPGYGFGLTFAVNLGPDARLRLDRKANIIGVAPPAPGSRSIRRSR